MQRKHLRLSNLLALCSIYCPTTMWNTIDFTFYSNVWSVFRWLFAFCGHVQSDCTLYTYITYISYRTYLYTMYKCMFACLFADVSGRFCGVRPCNHMALSACKRLKYLWL